eukprot:1138805-Pyramimonas_sp.AAC.1
MLLILPFLQKPEGGRRPIGILPTPVRVLGRLRHRGAERWEEVNHKDYMYGGKGRSCEMAVWGQAINNEAAIAS